MAHETCDWMEEGTTESSTPLDKVKPIAQCLGGFDLDGCASKDSLLARTNIREEGGLEADWSKYDTIWNNHPYGRGEPPKWLRKSNEAVENGAETVVTLSKGDQSTRWFQEWIEGRAELICVPYSRIKFVGYDNGAKFPNMYSVFGRCPESLIEWFDEIGWLVLDP